MRSTAALLISPLLGGLLGLAGAFVQAARTTVAGVALPWGVALAGLAVVLAARAVSVSAQRRSAGILLSLTWLAVSIMTAITTRSGDLVIQQQPAALTYLIGTTVVLAAVVMLPVRTATESAA